MKYTTFFICFAAGISFSFGQQATQNNSKILENGIVISQAKGVESQSTIEIAASPVRTIADWNLPECIDAERFIQEKMSVLHPDSENYAVVIQGYKDDLLKIKLRKETLTK